LEKKAAGGFMDRLTGWFPEREFFMRSQGQVRFIRISSRLQVIAACAALLALLVWGSSMAVVGVLQYNARASVADLLEREAKVETAESRVQAYRSGIDKVADDLERRQNFLEEVTDNVDLPKGGVAKTAHDTVSDSSSEAAKTVAAVSKSLPEAGRLARIEARQLAYAEDVTRYADQQSRKAMAAIRRVGLNPERMMAVAQRAQGGPFETLSTSRDGSLDPRFERLGLSLARMDTLERILDGIPQFLPTTRASMVTSSYGYRRDPFTGHGAFHAGLDFRAGYGAPIHAAADGVISFVGRKSGYGNCVEIDHGNGLLTRYAHMSAFRTHIGTKVSAGDVIGLIGSTGRSTGPHLHFEVRINNRAVNPRPFLEAAPHVFEETRGRRNGTAQPGRRPL
jgi:murein DD-endopeptidase MepM/ murein hydrolase activator NlpD